MCSDMIQHSILVRKSFCLGQEPLLTCLRIEALTSSKTKTSKVLRHNILLNNTFISSSIKLEILKRKKERVNRKTKLYYIPAFQHKILFNLNKNLKQFLSLNS